MADATKKTKIAGFEPDAQQRAAVMQTEGAVLLLAVPGSGKTTVLVSRLAHMVNDCSIPPENIMAVTYTVAAASDMKKRFIALFENSLGIAQRLRFRTINGLCASIIARCSRTVAKSAFTLMTDEGASAALIADILRKNGAEYPAEGDIRDARMLITYAKNMLLTDGEAAELELDCAPFAKVFADYRAYMRQNALMDYDDQLVYAYRILLKYPEELAYWREQCRYLLVDEAQDTSKIQHMIIALLASGTGNLFMVGDEDQSIYGFRAAYPAALAAFEKEHPGAKVLFLENNYRSGSSLCTLASAFIAHNRYRREKNMLPCKQGGDTRVAVEPVRDRFAQYEYIVKTALQGEGETAVLYRDNDSALPLIDLMTRSGVPYRTRGVDAAFFSNASVRDVRDIIGFAFAPSDCALFLRLYYKTSARIPKAAALAACERAERTGENVLQTLTSLPELAPYTRARVRTLAEDMARIPRVSATAALDIIAGSIGYEEYLQQHGRDPFRLRILEAIARREKNVISLLERLDELERTVREGTPDADIATPGGARLILSTVHSAKGLEFDRVILIDVTDGVLPKKAPPRGGVLTREEQEALEEERRVLYVGMTRARQSLTLIRYADPALTSCFMEELFPSKRQKAPEHRKAKNMPALGAEETQALVARLVPGAKLMHRNFGEGRVISAKNGIIKADIGGRERNFALVFAVSAGLIKPLD